MPEPSALLPLTGFEVGERSERVEYRVVVNPDRPKPHRWSFTVPPGGDPWAAARQFGAPTQVQEQTVVTYTSGWKAATNG